MSKEVPLQGEHIRIDDSNGEFVGTPINEIPVNIQAPKVSRWITKVNTNYKLERKSIGGMPNINPMPFKAFLDRQTRNVRS